MPNPFSSASTKVIFLLMGLVGITAIIAYLNSNSDDASDHTLTSPTIGETAVTPEGVNSDDSISEEKRSTSTSEVPTRDIALQTNAKSSQEMAAANQSQQDGNVSDSEDLERQILELVEITDVDRAIGYTEQLLQCKNARISQSQADQRIDDMDQTLLDSDIQLPASMLDMMKSALAQAGEASERCSSLLANRAELLGTTIFEQAQNGNPVARYVYAMLAPNDAVSTIMGEELASYDSYSLAFTLENLAERHPLGLLAMGISYSSGTHFTGHRPSLGSAYLKASQTCGINNDVVESFLKQNVTMRKGKALLEPVASDELINQTALRLVQGQCGG